ncbi:MAG: ZIP family metal transporter [Bacilli bacterium]|nr:ZIP family metal transporter [Bacilli bacterium]
MTPTVNAVIGLSIIFLATALGSAFVFFFAKKPISETVRKMFLGFAAGVMLAASIFSLIVPSLEAENPVMPTWIIVAVSVTAGALFMWGIDKLVPHFHIEGGEEGLHSNINKTAKMFLAVTIHNVPEGLSVGIAYGVALASWTANQEAALLGALMLAIGIAIQNIPEGAVVSLSMRGEGATSKKSFLFGVASGAVEPLAGIVGLFLAMQLQAVMPFALSFAAGCMLYVIAEEMIPDMTGDSTHHHGVWSFIAGFVLMMSLDVALG